jgi:hypothetical protein
MIYRDWEQILKLTRDLSWVMIAILCSSGPEHKMFGKMMDALAPLGNRFMAVAARLTRETSDHHPSIPCLKAAELGATACWLANVLFGKLEAITYFGGASLDRRGS